MMPELVKAPPAARARAQKLLAALRLHYPDARCELNYQHPHELLVATILSAQSTDIAVNKVTPALFERFPTPGAFAAVSPEDIQPFIRTLGLFRNKARAVQAAMATIVEEHDGKVPGSMEQLIALRGVARKTANVVLGNVFGLNEGVVVDTHVERLSKRLGLCPRESTVAKVEQHLMGLFPRDTWCELSHLLIFHGRRACAARMSRCCSHPICEQFGRKCELREASE